MIAIFCVAFALCAALTKDHVTSWNDGSRIATVDALTANGTFAIDGSPYAAHLGDKILYRGKHYSDKPPLLTLMAAGVTLAVAPLGITLRQTPARAIYLMTVLTVGVWFAIGCVYAYAFQRLLGFGSRIGVAVAALTGVGTLALPYATVLANHVPAGVAVLAGSYHVVRGRAGGAVHDVLTGLFFALAYAFDASAIVLALAGAVVLWGAPARRWIVCIAVGAPIVAIQLAFNLLISGSVLPTAFTGDVWTEFPRDPAAAAPQPFVLLTATEYVRLAIALIAGSKGLIAFTPLVLLVAYGVAVMWRSDGLRRRLALAIGVTTAVYFIMILTLQNVDEGAQNFGERRYVDLFFLMSVALGPALAAVRGAAAALAVRLCATVSIAIAALGTVAPFGGARGESGFSFGPAEFVALVHRAPIQAALDVLMLIVVVAVVLRLLPVPAPQTFRVAGPPLDVRT